MAQQCLDCPDRPCYGLEKARELEERINNDTKKNTETHREIYERVRKLEIDQTETKVQYAHIMETLGSIKADLADLRSKPGRRWESIVAAALSALVGGVVAFLLLKLGLGG